MVKRSNRDNEFKHLLRNLLKKKCTVSWIQCLLKDEIYILSRCGMLAELIIGNNYF